MARSRVGSRRLTLGLPGGETIVCDEEGLGDNAWADDVIRELQT